MASNGFTTQSSLAPNQEPVAQAMFEIFKSGLANGLPAYPGSSASAAFNPRSIQQNFRSQIGQPLGELYRNNFASLIGPSAQPYAQQRFDETIGGLGAQAGYVGERQAYQEYLRTQPSGDALNLGQSLLSQETTASYFPDDTNEWAQIALTAMNAAGTVYGASQMSAAPDTSAWQGISTAPTSPYQSDRYFQGRQPPPESSFMFDTSGLGF